MRAGFSDFGVWLRAGAARLLGQKFKNEVERNLFMATYKEIPLLSEEEIRYHLDGDDTQKKCEAIISASYSMNIDAVQDLCITLILEGNVENTRCAIYALGHLVRIHENLNMKMILPIIREIELRKEYFREINDLWDDIMMFYKGEYKIKRRKKIVVR